MRVRVFKADNMNEALRRVRADLGADALILGTRPLGGGIEVTAASDAAGAEAEASAAVMPWRPRKLAEAPALAAMAQFHGVPEALARRLAHGPLASGLAQALRFRALTAEPALMLFVGPVGAGKTSTVARLATRMVLAGERPLVITTDTRRPGAIEQLAAYTRLLGLTLIAASGPEALARAVERREGQAPVLIDTAGSDGRSAAEMAGIGALAQAVLARPILVLPAGMEANEGIDIGHAYAERGTTMLVATRLDLVRRLGSLLAAVDASALAFAEAGIGPGAADGMVPMTPGLLAGMLQEALPRALHGGERAEP